MNRKNFRKQLSFILTQAIQETNFSIETEPDKIALFKLAGACNHNLQNIESVFFNFELVAPLKLRCSFLEEGHVKQIEFDFKDSDSKRRFQELIIKNPISNRTF